jgi:hypothetical protein
MPQYFFHFQDGEKDVDKDGVELPNVHAAREQGLRLAAETLHQMDANTFLQHGHWELVVTDQPAGNGRRVFRLVVAASEGDDPA